MVAFLLLLLVGCTTTVVSCSSGVRQPPCDAATARQMEMSCFARVQTECVDKGVPEEQCGVIAECDALADARKNRCAP